MRAERRQQGRGAAPNHPGQSRVVHTARYRRLQQSRPGMSREAQDRLPPRLRAVQVMNRSRPQPIYLFAAPESAGAGSAPAAQT